MLNEEKVSLKTEEKSETSRKEGEFKRIDITDETKEKVSAEYNLKRNEILKKNADDIESVDLPYITKFDKIFKELPFKFKRIVQKNEEAKGIFSQINEIECLLKDESVNEINPNSAILI